MEIIRYTKGEYIRGYFIPEKDLLIEDFEGGIQRDRPFSVSDPEFSEEVKSAYKGKKIEPRVKWVFTSFDYDSKKIEEFIENIRSRDELEQKVANAFYGIAHKFNSENKSNQRKTAF